VIIEVSEWLESGLVIILKKWDVMEYHLLLLMWLKQCHYHPIFDGLYHPWGMVYDIVSTTLDNLKTSRIIQKIDFRWYIFVDCILFATAILYIIERIESLF